MNECRVIGITFPGIEFNLPARGRVRREPFSTPTLASSPTCETELVGQPLLQQSGTQSSSEIGSSDGQSKSAGLDGIERRRVSVRPALLASSAVFALSTAELAQNDLREPRVSTLCSHTFSFGPQSALDPDGVKVKNDDPGDCSPTVVCTRWWWVGIFSLAQVAPR